MSSSLESGFLNSQQAQANRQKLREVRPGKPDERPTPGKFDAKSGKPEERAAKLRKLAELYTGEAKQKLLRQAEELLRNSELGNLEGPVN